MDKQIAKQIAEEKLNQVTLDDKAKVLNLFVESEQDFFTKDGIEYQIRTEAFYDDKEKKIIRVCVSVDDQKFWSTLFPLSRSELIDE